MAAPCFQLVAQARALGVNLTSSFSRFPHLIHQLILLGGDFETYPEPNHSSPPSLLPPGTSHHPQYLLHNGFTYVDDYFLNRLLLVIDDYTFVIFYLYHYFYFLLVGFLVFKRNFLIFTFLQKLLLVTVCTHGLFYYLVYYKPFLSLFILLFKLSQSSPVRVYHASSFLFNMSPFDFEHLLVSETIL